MGCWLRTGLSSPGLNMYGGMVWCLGRVGSGGTVCRRLSFIVTMPCRSFSPIHFTLVLCCSSRFCGKAVGSRILSRFVSQLGALKVASAGCPSVYPYSSSGLCYCSLQI